MIIIPAVQQFLGRRSDRLALLLLQLSELAIHAGGTLLNQGQRVNNFARHLLRADFEVLQAALSLGPHRLSAGTCNSPNVSRSTRTSIGLTSI